MEQQEGLNPKNMGGMVLDKFLVDVFKPKSGVEKDIVVFTFLAKQKESARDLYRFIDKGPFDLIDVEASSAPDEDGNYMIFVEMNRNRNMFGIMDDILQHIDYLVDVHRWRFRPYSHTVFIEWNRDNFVKTVPQSPAEYTGDRPKTPEKNPEEKPTNTPDIIESNQLLLRKFIDKQINRHSKTYIQSLQDQIHSVIQDNQRLLEHIEELKAEQQYLHQQLDIYQKRENMSVEREEKIYSRIKDLEDQVIRFANIKSQTPIETVDDKITPAPEETSENTESKIELGYHESDLEAETGEVISSDDDIDAAIDLQYENGALFDDSDLGQVKDHLEAGDTNVDAVEQPPNEEKILISEEADAPGVFDPSSEVKVLPLEPPGLSDEFFADEEDIYTDISEENDINSVLDMTDSDDLDSSDITNIDGVPVAVDENGNLSDESEFKEKNHNHKNDVIEDLEDTILEFESILENEAASIDFLGTQNLNENGLDSDEDKDEIQTATDQTDSDGESIHELEAVVEPEDIAEDEYGLALLSEPQKHIEDTQPDEIGRAIESEKAENKIHELGSTVEVETDEDKGNKKNHAKMQEKSEEKIRTTAAGQTVDSKKSADSINEPSAIENKDDEKINYSNSAVSSGHSSEAHKEQVDGITPVKPDENLEDTIHELESIVDAENAEAVVIDNSNIRDMDTGVSDIDYSDHEMVNKYLRKGLDAYESKSYVKSIEYFTKSIEISPKTPAAFLNLAVIAYRLKDYETSRSHAVRALELGSKSAEKIIEKADAKLQVEVKNGHVESAEALSQQETPSTDASEMAASKPTTEVPQESLEPESEETDEVIELDQSAVIEEPEIDGMAQNEESQTDLASVTEVVSTKQQQHESVDETDDIHANNAAERDIASEYIALGIGATEQKKYDKAMAYFKKATEISPDLTAGFLNLAVLSYRLKDYKVACTYANQAIDLGSKSAHKILEKAEKKVRRTKKVDQIEPPSEEPEIHVVDNANPNEKEYMSKSFDNDRQHPRPQRMLQKENTDFRDKPAEIKEIEEITPEPDQFDESVSDEIPEPDSRDQKQMAIGSKDTDSQVETVSEDELANQYFSDGLEASEQKEYVRAIECFTKAIELSPTLPAGYLNLAVLTYRLTDYAKAHRHATRALELGSKSAQKIIDKAQAKLKIASKQDEAPPSQTDQEKEVLSVEKTVNEKPDASKNLASNAQNGDMELEDEVVVFEQNENADVPEGIEATTGQDIDTETGFTEESETIPDDKDRATNGTDSKGMHLDTVSAKELANEYFRLGEDAIEQKAYHKAIKCFDKVTELLPKARRSYIKLSVLYYQLKNYPKAMDYAQKALDLGSRSAHKILLKAQNKLAAVNTSETADTSTTSAVPQRADKDSDAEKPTTSEELTGGDESEVVDAQSQSQKNDTSKTTSRPDVRKGTSNSDPDQPGAPSAETSQSNESTVADNYTVNEYFAMGLAASERQDFTQAIEYFTKVTELIPNASSSFLNLANLYFNLKDYQTARTHAQRALDLGSKSAQRLLDDIDEITKAPG